MNIATSGLATVLCLGIAMGANAQQPCGVFAFPDQQDLHAWVFPSLAKVYEDDKGTAYHGTATLIDAASGILITAAHVVSGEVMYLRFPALQDNEVYIARRVLELPQADGVSEYEGGSWGRPRDISLLKMDRVPFGIKPIEVWLSEDRVMGEKIAFYGFADDAETPSPGGGAAGIPRGNPMCTRDIREATWGGDSGSPVVSMAGLLVGVMIQSKRDGQAGRYVPTKCLASPLVGYLGSGAGDSAIQRLKATPMGVAILMLKPPQRDEKWINNLELYSAIKQISDGKEAVAGIRQLKDCPLPQAIFSRGLGSELYTQYLKAVAISPNAYKELADDHMRSGKLLQAAGDVANAAVSFQGAERGYTAFIAAAVQSGGPTSPVSRALLSQAYKGLSDSKQKRAQLDPQVRKTLLIQARTAAARAYFLADENLDKGAAVATIAIQSSKLGDHQVAIEGFSAAEGFGFEAPWVKNGFESAFSKRDNVTVPSDAVDYKPIGKYQFLSEDKLLNYAKAKNLGLRF